MNNYKHNLLKRVGSMSNEEVFDAIAGPERRIRLIHTRSIAFGVLMAIILLPGLFLDDIWLVRGFAGAYFAMTILTWVLWNGTIDTITELGERYRAILDDMLNFYNSREDDWWKGGN